MTVPVYVVAAVVLTAFSIASDKLQTRGMFMATASTISAIGYVFVPYVPSNDISLSPNDRLLLVTENVRARYFAVFCIVSGTYTSIGLTIAWCKYPSFFCCFILLKPLL